MNFLVVLVDTFRLDNLGCYAHLRGRFRTPGGAVRTPHLDRFAELCTVFDRAYTGAFPTVPNRKDVFKGRTTFPFDDRWAPLEEDAVTFVGALGAAGYETMTVQDCPHLIPKQMGFERDFDGHLYIPGQEGHKLASWQVAATGDLRKTRAAGQLWQHLANAEWTRRSEEDCYSVQTIRQGVRWLEGKYQRDRKGKFLLYLDCFDPHEPWDAPSWYERQYTTGESYEVPLRYPGPCEATAYTPAEIDHLRGLYAAEVTMVDRWLGYLFRALENLSLLDNTCVLFTSDHGYYFGEHGLVAKSKGLLYEELTHVPLLIHLPGQRRARRVGQLVQPADLAPTMLELAGLPQPQTMFGHSLCEVLTGSRRQVRRQAASGHFLPAAHPAGDYRQVTLTERHWSLLFPGRGGGRPELYHLATDPHQAHDVLTHNLSQARAMHRAYCRWLESIDAPAEFGIPEV